MTDAERSTLKFLRLKVRLRDRPLKPGYTYTSVEDWLLTNGRLWTPAPLPARIRPMPIKQCYQNAFLLAARSKGRYRYVEGIAYGVIPDIDHAWCVDDQDRVLDPTWCQPNRPDGGPGLAYFGAVFELDALRELRADTDLLSILHDYPRKYPLLKQPRRPAHEVPMVLEKNRRAQAG
jgi:hypothetical protein